MVYFDLELILNRWILRYF